MGTNAFESWPCIADKPVLPVAAQHRNTDSDATRRLSCSLYCDMINSTAMDVQDRGWLSAVLKVCCASFCSTMHARPAVATWTYTGMVVTYRRCWIAAVGTGKTLNEAHGLIMCTVLGKDQLPGQDAAGLVEELGFENFVRFDEGRQGTSCVLTGTFYFDVVDGSFDSSNINEAPPAAGPRGRPAACNGGNGRTQPPATADLNGDDIYSDVDDDVDEEEELQHDNYEQEEDADAVFG